MNVVNFYAGASGLFLLLLLLFLLQYTLLQFSLMRHHRGAKDTLKDISRKSEDHESETMI